jgi:hypothetical protein
MGFGQQSGALMAEGLLHPARPRLWRLQFSLAGIFVLMTLSAVATWFWYQRPFEVENKEYSSAVDPFAAPGAATAGSLLRREVTSVRRVWGGNMVRHGPRRVYDANDNLLIAENYRNGQEHGAFIQYGPAGNRMSLVTYDRGQKHGPSRRWDSKGALLEDENYSRGLRHGAFEFRRGNGQSIVQGQFDQGVPAGRWTWFPATGTAIAANVADNEFRPRKRAVYSPSTSNTFGMIVGEWRDGLPDGRWEWRNADDEAYLTVDFERGRITSEEGADYGPNLPKLLAKAAGEDPRLLVRLFAAIDFDFTNMPLKDVALFVQESAQLPVRIDVRGLEEASISVDLPITYKAQGLPLLISLGQMLKPHEAGCDYRYGMLCIDALDSIAKWKDETGVTEITPPKGSRLAREWNKTTTLEVIEMPLKDVLLYLTEVYGGNVLFDVSRLPASTGPNFNILAADSLITTNLRGISLQNCLGIILDQLGCKASLKGEVIVIEEQ